MFISNSGRKYLELYLRCMVIIAEFYSADSTVVVVNLSSLKQAGVDISNASVAVSEDTEAQVNATLTRSDQAGLIRIELSPQPDAPRTDIRFELMLTGLDTNNATHTRLNYDIRYDGERGGTPKFGLTNPDLPWVSTLTLRTDSETDVTIEMTIHGLDTQQADPTEQLQHVIHYEPAAGTMSGTTEPFGLYAPDNTPTPTPSPHGPITPTPGSNGPGFGLVVTLLAMVGALSVARRL